MFGSCKQNANKGLPEQDQLNVFWESTQHAINKYSKNKVSNDGAVLSIYVRLLSKYTQFVAARRSCRRHLFTTKLVSENLRAFVDRRHCQATSPPPKTCSSKVNTCSGALHNICWGVYWAKRHNQLGGVRTPPKWLRGSCKNAQNAHPDENKVGGGGRMLPPPLFCVLVAFWAFLHEPRNNLGEVLTP